MRIHTLIFAAVVGVLSASESLVAEQWVSKLLVERDHDFGNVARGADTIYRFPIKNVYKQRMELVKVRSSCGCTSVSLENKSLETGETGYVVANFNTRTYTGQHAATLTLTVAWNDNGVRRRGEGQLHVHGNIRSDVVFSPGAVRFESVDQGDSQEQRVKVSYAGRSDWRITDVRGSSDHLEVELAETRRRGSRVTYELLVRMKETAPAGYFRDQLVLVTSDRRNVRIPLDVEGRVIGQISVSPKPLMFGEVVHGNAVPKKILVRGKQPFKIVEMTCDDACFEFKTDEDSRDRHIVEVVFAAKCKPGQVKKTIHIVTDLGEKYEATLTAHATVTPAPSDSEADESEPGDGTPTPATAERGASSDSVETGQVATQ